MKLAEYIEQDATGLARLIAEGEITALDALGAAKELRDLWNPKLNSIVFDMEGEAERLIEELDAQAPLYGVPFLIKDIGISYKGFPTTHSCRIFAQSQADHDSELMVRYKKAGLITFGKTNTPEFGLKGVTESEFRGPCRNPWSFEHSPGGSSGGAAAAVAAGIVPVAHANDGGGSIRIPASCTGLVGLKPSRGRIPMGPVTGESWMGQVCNHVLSRTVRDSALLLDLTHGMDPGSPYTAPPVEMKYTQAMEKPVKKMKIAFSSQSLYGKGTHPDCIEAIEKTVQLCRDLGHEVIEDQPAFSKSEMTRAYLIIVASALASELREASRIIGRPLRASDMELASWILTLIGRAVSGEDLAHAVGLSRRVGRELGSFFARYDLFLLPTLAYPPPRIGELDFSSKDIWTMKFLKLFPFKSLLLQAMEQIAEESFEQMPNTELFNQTGNPAISLPLHWNASGLPIGAQFVSAYGREDQLLQVARQLEEARPWKNRFPQID